MQKYEAIFEIESEQISDASVRKHFGSLTVFDPNT